MKACLLVGEYEENGIAKLVFGKHAHELFARFAHSLSIVAVDNEDQTYSASTH